MSTALSKLCEWYKSNCNGDWEHEFGINIGTLDNPGWKIEIDLSLTDFETKPIPSYQSMRTENDWIVIQEIDNKNGRAFSATGGPENLEEMIAHFLKWTAEAEQENHP